MLKCNLVLGIKSCMVFHDSIVLRWGFIPQLYAYEGQTLNTYATLDLRYDHSKRLNYIHVMYLLCSRILLRLTLSNSHAK